MDEVLAAVIQLYNRVVTFVYETSLLDIRVATARFTDERLASFFYTRSKLTHETLRRHIVAHFVQVLSKNSKGFFSLRFSLEVVCSRHLTSKK